METVFPQELGKSASETSQMIKQVYGKEALDHSAAFKWHKCYAQGRDCLEDTGRPRMARIELRIQEITMLVHANRSKLVDKSQ
jgi:hypothetical protein